MRRKKDWTGVFVSIVVGSVVVLAVVIALGVPLWISVALIGWQHTKYAIVALMVLVLAGSGISFHGRRG